MSLAGASGSAPTVPEPGARSDPRASEFRDLLLGSAADSGYPRGNLRRSARPRGEPGNGPGYRSRPGRERLRNVRSLRPTGRPLRSPDPGVVEATDPRAEPARVRTRLPRSRPRARPALRGRPEGPRRQPGRQGLLQPGPAGRPP